MSLTSALNSAGQGLAMTETLSRITAGNISNTMTPGYVRREAHLVSTGPQSDGVRIGEIRREIDSSLTRMDRAELAKVTRYQAVNEGLLNYTLYLGQPGDGTSPAEKFSAFSGSLTTLANMPSATGAQMGAVQSAEELAASLRGATRTLDGIRSEVDMEIRYEVADLNQALHDLATLNQRTQETTLGTLEMAGLEDGIDTILDQVANIADIRVARGSNGMYNVFTTGGIALVEGSRVHTVTYNPGDGTLKAGEQDITPNRAGVRGLEQGSLVGFSELRSDILPRFQLQLDEFARTLVQSFEAADASLTPGQAGLFTDNGNAYDPSKLTGLAGRIEVNALVRQTGGGQPWRMRDGLGATAPGDASDATQLQAFMDTFDTPVTVDAATRLGDGLTLARLGAEIISAQSSERTRAEKNYQAAASAAEVVRSARQNVEGVNIDEEMQKLIVIEQSYAANAKMLSAVADMFDTLLGAV